MDIDPETAKALGFPKPAFTVVEYERRWLCRDVPREKVIRSERITDLYVAGSRLRLREARPIDGGPARLRLSRKADVDSRTRLITSIYLPEEEFAVLAASLPGLRIEKLRHTLRSRPDRLRRRTTFHRIRLRWWRVRSFRRRADLLHRSVDIRLTGLE